MDKPSPLPLSRRAAQPDAIAPDGSEIRLLTDGRHSASRSSMVEVTLPAGQVSRPVYHRTVEETWYILEGRGQVWRCPPDADAASVPAQDVSPGDGGWSCPVAGRAAGEHQRFQFEGSASRCRGKADAASLRFLCHTMPPWPGEDEAVAAGSGGLGEPTV